MQVGKNTVVTLHYRLQIDNAQGELVEETFGSEPLTFLFGVGQMIPDFEDNLAGKNPGDEFSFTITSENAYGEYNPQAIVKLPLETFNVSGKQATEWLEAGMTIPMADAQGNRLTGVVQEIAEDGVVMDFNHPMAGQDLYFTVNIESVREATEEELAHGHVHGEGGVIH